MDADVQAVHHIISGFLLFMLVLLVVWFTAWTWLGSYLSSRRGHGAMLGLVLGFLLQPIGVIIILLMPPGTLGHGTRRRGTARTARQGRSGSTRRVRGVGRTTVASPAATSFGSQPAALVSSGPRARPGVPRTSRYRR